MADIDIEKKEKKGMGILPWILGLLLLALILWGLTQCGDGGEEAVVVPADTAVTDPAAVAAPVPMDTGMAMADTTATGAAGAAGALPIAQILANPGQFGAQTVEGTARVAEVVSDRGFWIEDAGQRMFVVLDEPQGAEPVVDIDAGQSVRLSGQVRDGSALGQLTTLEQETRQVAQGQPAFLIVRPAGVTIAGQ
ncbi:MAG: hypothetical protein AB1941_18630 [Gemmatimonadota bacterium]